MQYAAAAARRRVAGLLLFFLLLGRVAFAQAPAWQTAVATHQVGNYFARVSATATDASGNVYLAGHFTGAVSFGATTLTTTDRADIFVAKWSASSHGFVWAQQAGGAGLDIVTALALDGASVYLTGAFDGPMARFGSTTLATSNGSGGNAFAGQGTPFVVKLIDAGPIAGFAWAQRVDGTSGTASAVAVNGANVYIAGQFSGTARFGPTALTAAAGDDVFVAKLLDTGTAAAFVWAQQAGGAGDETATALAVNGAGVYVTGRFNSQTATFGRTALANANPAGTYQLADIFVAKLTDAGPAGGFTWAQQAGGAGPDSALGVAVNGPNVYIAGYFSGPSAAFGTSTLAGAGASNALVAKLTDDGPAGRFVWVQRVGGTGSDSATAVAVRGPSVYIAGTFGSVQAVFGPTTLTNAGRAGSRDVFVAKLTDTGGGGGFDWAQQAGGAGDDFATSVAVNGAAVYVGGGAAPPTKFGPLVLAVPAGTQGGFLASLAELTATATATAAAPVRFAFTLAPNPARTAATLTLPAVPGAPTAVLTLLDALGRVVRTETVGLPAAGLRHELPLLGLPAGLYDVRVAAGAATATRRLVVE